MLVSPRSSAALAVVAASAALAAHAAALAAQPVTIGTGPPPATSPYAALLGTSGPLPSFAVGQSFAAPSGVRRLDAVQFWVRNDPNAVLPPNDFRLLTYRLFVTAYDSVARQVAGSPLFVSASRPGFASTAAAATSFSTGGLAVQPGALYLAFLVPDEPTFPFPLSPHQGEALGFNGDAYAGGRAYTIQYLAGFDPGPLTGVWTAQAGDFAFSAAFDAVPEPATWALVGAGLLTTGAAARVRQRVRRR